MRKTCRTELLLARLTNPTRAAAIYGDLTEMAATRGRLWFVAAYLRTLFTFTWRIVLALFVADVGRQLAFDTNHLNLLVTPAAWRANTGSFVNLLNSSGPLIACIMSTLWFALFFALVRYGRRDAFVRLTALVTAGAFLAFLAIPWISLVAAAATLALTCAAFLSARWRKPFEVLAWTGAAWACARTGRVHHPFASIPGATSGCFPQPEQSPGRHVRPRLQLSRDRCCWSPSLCSTACTRCCCEPPVAKESAAA